MGQGKVKYKPKNKKKVGKVKYKPNLKKCYIISTKLHANISTSNGHFVKLNDSLSILTYFEEEKMQLY